MVIQGSRDYEFDGPSPPPPAGATSANVGVINESAGVTRRRLLQVGAGAGVALATAGALGRSPAAFGAAAKIKRGGTLRVGSLGGTAQTESINPYNNGATEVDVVRLLGSYERLVTWNTHGVPVPQLAEAFSYSPDLKTWKIKLVTNRHWHDGSPFTADDVVYSLRWVLDPANKALPLPDVSFIKPSDVTKIDKSTVRIQLQQPFALLPTSLSNRTLFMVKAGSAPTFGQTVNGTGPFIFKSWTPGVQSLSVRNPNYPVHNGPYVDSLEVFSFADPTAQLNALQAGQLDAINDIDPRTVAVINAQHGLAVLRAEGSTFTPFSMLVDQQPFVDVRVREAFKLMTDREQMIKDVLVGEGRIANDLVCPQDPYYPTLKEVPQRPYDPEKAKALLQQAGMPNVSVALYTGDAAPGMLDSATLFVNQAKAAGVTVTLNTVPGDQYFNLPQYLSAPFEQSFWGGRPLYNQITASFTCGRANSETHWDVPSYTKLFNEASKTANTKRRREMFVELERIQWNQGGYIIWAFENVLDAHSTKFTGFHTSPLRWLGFYDFLDVHEV